MAAKCTLHVSYPCVKCPCVMSMCPWVFLTRAVCVRGQTVNLPSDSDHKADLAQCNGGSHIILTGFTCRFTVRYSHCKLPHCKSYGDIRVSIYSAITSVLSRYIIHKSISTRKRVREVKLGFERSDIGKKW